MSLRSICRDEDIDNLKVKQKVKIIIDPKRPPLWSEEATFYGREQSNLGFIARARHSNNLYLIEFTRSDLLPTFSGEIEIRERQAFIYQECSTDDPRYEYFDEFIGGLL